MKVILEREDLLAILSKAVGYALQDEDVTLNTEPFEAHIRKVPVDELAERAVTKHTVEEPRESPEDEEYLEEDEGPAVEAVLTMEEILKQNVSMSHTSTRTVGNPPGIRPLGPYESEEPPGITEDEINALTR